MTKTVPLFGGAMSCLLSDRMVDVSDFRQVPDHQEVHSDPETGATVIVELMSRQSEVSDADAAGFFYSDLAKDNGCGPSDVTVTTSAALPPSAYPQLATAAATANSAAAHRCAYACLVTGSQRISKYTNEEGKASDIFVGLAVLRLPPPVATEVLVSLSAPQWIHPESSDAAAVKRLMTEEERLETLRVAVHSMQVCDWGLFVPEE